jgi:hypothetical protein
MNASGSQRAMGASGSQRAMGARGSGFSTLSSLQMGARDERER